MKISVSKEISSLVPYPPGKPIEELERELGIKGSIKLASNENPFGPSKKAIDAVAEALANLHRYPDGSCFYLKERLSKFLDVEPEMLIIGNGSNEIIELVIKAYLRPGHEAVMAAPSFAVYPIAINGSGGKAVSVPLKGFRHDLEAMATAISRETRLVFIANPNNPTGTIVTDDELSRFLKAVPDDVIVCVDEAYYEFVQNPGFPKTLEHVKMREKAVLLIRTFSKVYGLAGLRVGYGVADASLVDYMERVRQPFNVNSLAQAAALAALDDRGHLNKTVQNNIQGLDYLLGELKAMGLECVPTEANFFLVRAGEGKKVYDALLKKGVIVRPMDSYGLGEYIRVTVGLPEENSRFISSLQEVLGLARRPL